MTNRNRRALLGAIVAATLASASGQLSGYTNSSYARTLSQRLFRTQLAVLQATPLTCALPVGSDGTVGNMWARLKSGSSSIATVNSLAIGASVPIPISDLEGPVPWLLGTWFPNQANVTFKYVAVKINSNVVPMHDRTAVAVAAMTATGADCILDGITVDTKVSAIFRMSSPISAYGYQVVTPRPTLKGETTMQQIWLWTQPYSWPVWIVVIAIFLSTAFIAAILDFDYRHTKDTDFLDDVPLGRNVAHFLYLSAVTLTGHGSFRPYSAPGRLYMMTKAFCLLILWACYRAALTAYFVSPPYPKQYVSTIMDFLTAGGTGAPACITDDPFSHNFFVHAYPQIKTRVIDGATTKELLGVVKSKSCYAAVAPSDELAFYLGKEDKTGKYCKLQTKDYLGNFMRVIPFNPATVGPITDGYDNPGWFDGFFRVVCKSTNDFNFSNYKEKWFTTTRPLCFEAEEYERKILKQEVPGVSILQVIGIFAIQAMGFFCGLVLHVRDTFYPSTLPHDITMKNVPEDELDDELRELENMAHLLMMHKNAIASAAITAGNADQLRAMQARHSEAETTFVNTQAARMSTTLKMQRSASNMGDQLPERVRGPGGIVRASSRLQQDAAPKRGSRGTDMPEQKRNSRASDMQEPKRNSKAADLP